MNEISSQEIKGGLCLAREKCVFLLKTGNGGKDWKSLSTGSTFLFKPQMLVRLARALCMFYE